MKKRVSFEDVDAKGLAKKHDTAEPPPPTQHDIDRLLSSVNDLKTRIHSMVTRVTSKSYDLSSGINDAVSVGPETTP